MIEKEKLSGFIRTILKNICLIVGIIAVLEFVQGQNLRDDPLPRKLLEAHWPTLEGENRRLLTKSDSVHLIYVFAPWCQVCALSASSINSLELNYPSVALAMSYESRLELLEFKKEHQLKAPVILGGTDPWIQALGIEAFPSFFIVRGDGEIIYSWEGYSSLIGLKMKLWLAGIAS